MRFPTYTIYQPQSILRLLKSKNADRPVKVDDTFPSEQFKIEGYSRPIRKDRNCHGGGLMIFTRDDLTYRELSSHILPSDVECTFL